ncbi:MAG: hypothetical protein JXA42_26205 [Anaerolineales bacterium]|nr:hypothetical protein [Anaerolineales bacterium]
MTETITDQHHLDRAYDLENQGLFREALSECNLAIQAGPDLAEAYNLKGIILDQLGDAGGAIEAYRKAIELWPDFDEAIQNLQEAREDMEAPQVEVDQNKLVKATLIGALGFGISFAIAKVVQGLIGQSLPNSVSDSMTLSSNYRYGVEFFVSAFFYSIAAGIGAGFLAKTVVPEKLQSIVLVNSIGFGISYLVARGIVKILASIMGIFGLFNSVFTLLSYLDALEFAIPGIIVCFLFGLIRKNKRRQLLWSAVAGSAFGLDGLTTNFWFLQKLLTFFYSNESLSTFDSQHSNIIFIGMYYVIQGLIAGGAAGAALGFVQAYFGGGRIVEETPS